MDFGKNAAGEPILTLTNLEADIYCASSGIHPPRLKHEPNLSLLFSDIISKPTEGQHLATYKVTVRYMFEKPHTFEHQKHVGLYSVELWKMINSKLMSPTITAAAPAPISAAAVFAAAAAAAASSVDWTWEETTHHHYTVGYKVEVLTAFKSKYSAFVGSTAIIRKIFAKKFGPDKYSNFTFFLEVQGKDADETAKFGKIIEDHNRKCFTDFLCGDARSLLPCRQKHMRLISMDTATASSSNSKASNSNGGSKRPADDAGGGAKKARLEQQDAPPVQSDIKLGDVVEILNTLYTLKEFVGFHGIVRRIEQRSSFMTCWVEIHCNHAGQAVDVTEVVRKKNKRFYTEEAMWLSWVCCRVENVVRADPGLPDPWTPETWAALPVSDRKMHRQQQQQDKDAAAKKEGGGKTSSKFDALLDAALAEMGKIAEIDKIAAEPREIVIGDNVEIKRIIGRNCYPQEFIGFQGVVQSIEKNLFHSTCFVELKRNQAGVPVTLEQTKTIEDWNKGMCTPEERSFMKCNIDYIALADPNVPPSSSKPHGDRVRHRKYNPLAKSPWSGGDVKPFLYGRKITFILQGKRGEPITR